MYLLKNKRRSMLGLVPTVGCGRRAGATYKAEALPPNGLVFLVGWGADKPDVTLGYVGGSSRFCSRPQQL
jgi:hypothetical protein